ncbi:MAG: class I tRNA ligase family protein, partial [Thermodesulfovibrionia bacterium]|nr:class I tRNA ligase family protein [Thermodesulfovibrionia bacterium]
KELTQDEDVLDTWFSSALWPFSTLGWPDETDDLKTFYPGNVLITGFDILFFWVARMIMMGLKFMAKEPFRHTYIHALIRDAEGQKMSKSKGNVVDPLEMTETYGTDAFRFTLAAFAAQGRDIKFSLQRVEGYRHFINKIWNAARFILTNISKDEEIKSVKEIKHLSLADRWILSRLSVVASEVNKSFEEYRFNDAANLLYQFIWHEFCDWHLEMIKPAFYGKEKEPRESAVSTVVHVFETALALLHPLIPFVTEELWQGLPIKNKSESLCVRKYPTETDGILDKDAEHKMGFIIDAVTGIRNIRGELNLSPALELNALIKTQDNIENILNENITYISHLAKTSSLKIGQDVKKPEDAAVSVKPPMEIFVPLKGLFDVNAEIKRLSKEIDKIKESISVIQKKLSNEDFLNKAPKAVIDENKAKHQEFVERMQAIYNSIEKLKKMEEIK